MAETISLVTPDNLDQCVELFATVFNSEPWNDKWNFETAKKRLLGIYNTPNFIGFTYLFDSELLGFVVGNCEQWYNGEIYYLKEMCVSTDMQGRQIGTKLINFLRYELVKKGIERAYLITLEGGQAEHFYAKNGYRKSLNSILMSCQLNDREG
jgi:GNAT superfamily N-acetyltransferase